MADQPAVATAAAIGSAIRGRHRTRRARGAGSPESMIWVRLTARGPYVLRSMSMAAGSAARRLRARCSR
ncbi:hypothetical protein SAMN05444920_10215 [Nonomuraea solani]|uniref:Uncharacterized protein n=2 Tax=Nonomuraea solani TaxID=1144553 RepID=A0A1H5XTH0_9ACTN|nr:hypothetical protein SAMN05444920_10215 [Nonomuraea solani]